jgi:type I restriction enzyme, S subunit
MLPWLQELPNDWDVVQARRLFRERRSTGFDDRPLLSVTQNAGVVTREDSELRVWNPGADISGYKLVLPGDFVISLRSFQGGLERSEREGLVSPAYTPIYSTILDDPQLEFLRHYFKSSQFVSSLQPLTSGIRQGKSISFADFGESPLPIPPTDEAQALASFLDRETARIDTLIEMKRRLLDLLEEKRTAVITRAVTRGLDPGVPMKDSAVEWIGEIPLHWEVARLKHLTPPDRPITYGIVQAGPHVPNGIPYIRTSDMASDALPVDGYQRTSKEIDAQYARSRVRSGDIVVAIRATVGKSLLVPEGLPQANLTQGTARVAAGPRVLPAFVQLGLSSGQTQQRFNALAKGATFREITLRMLRELEFCVPPLQEQRAIVEHLERETGQLTRLRWSVRRGIELLQEYRTAMISASVTGAIGERQRVARPNRRIGEMITSGYR